MTATWPVRAHRGIGPLRLGVTRAAAEEAGASLPDPVPGEGVPQPGDPVGTQLDSGLMVHQLIGEDGLVEAIEVWHPVRGPGPSLELDGVALFGATRAEAGDLLVSSGGEVHEDANGLVSRALDVGLTVEDGQVVAVLVGVPGYYAFLDLL